MGTLVTSLSFMQITPEAVRDILQMGHVLSIVFAQKMGEEGEERADV